MTYRETLDFLYAQLPMYHRVGFLVGSQISEGKFEKALAFCGSGMGIHIARALLDEVIYEPGPPNLWRLHKQLSPSPTTAATTSAGTSA